MKWAVILVLVFVAGCESNDVIDEIVGDGGLTFNILSALP